MTVTQVRIEKQKIEFLLPASIPAPKYRISQLVEVFSAKHYKNPKNKAWFPCRITGMAWSTYQGKKPEWDYQVQFLNCTGECFEWFSEDEIHLLEDY